MGLIQQIKQFISPDGQVAQNELPMPLEEVWTKHSFTPIVNWMGAYKMWKANPVAQACTLTYSLMMPEAQLGVVTPTGYDYDQPIVSMLTRNQWRVTMAEVMTILCIGGNAYGYKLRNAAGAVIGVRWYSDKYFAPVNDGWGDVSHYHYYNGAVTYTVPKENVIHIVGFWYDPEKPLGGGSPVELAAQSIEGYNEASATVFNIHKNDAMPKTLLVYDEELSQEQASLAQKSFSRKYGGERRGSVGIVWGVKDVKRLALDWNELGLSDTFGQYETRICGAYKVHPIIAGTHMGLSQSTYSNFEQASKDFTNMVRVPFWNMLADQLNAQLAIPEYGVELGFDLSTVQSLAGDVLATEAVSTQDNDINDDNGDGGAVPVEARSFRLPAVETKQYEGIDFAPPKGVRDEAAKGLEWRREYNRGGTAVGVARARDLSNGRAVSPDTIRRMNSYFARHAVDKQGEGWSPGQDGFPSAGRIAWALWGGDAGETWSAKVLAQMNAEDERESRVKVVIGPETKAWLQHPDSHVYAKQYDEVLGEYDVRIARSWSKTLMELATYLRDTKTAGAPETKAEDFNVDIWTQRFLDSTENDRNELIELVIKLSQEEVDAEPGEFAQAREAGQRESSDQIKQTVITLREDVQKVILANPTASGDELGKLLYDRFEELRKPLLPTTKQSRADVIGRTTATATTGTVQKSVWSEIGGITRTWAALAGARATHAAAHDTPENENGMFNVGGEMTPYPAGPGLSAKNSVNCRCFARARRAV